MRRYYFYWLGRRIKHDLACCRNIEELNGVKRYLLDLNNTYFREGNITKLELKKSRELVYETKLKVRKRLKELV